MEQKIKKIDIRIIKTKRAIREATLRLLSQKALEEISITELAEEAQINRKTFYNYYQSLSDVVEEIENDTVEKFVSAIKAKNCCNDENLDFYQLFLCITEAVRDNMEFFGYLLNISKNSRLIVKIETRLRERGMAYFAKYLEVEEDVIALVMDYVVSGMCSVYRRWFQSGKKADVDKIARSVGLMSLGAVNAMLEEYSLQTKKLSLK